MLILGERRIRVITSAVPISSNLSDIFASADQVAIATLLANKAVERSITHKLEDARDALFGKLVEILGAYKASMTAAGAGASAQLAISENLKMLPVLVLGLLKNVSGLLILFRLKFWHSFILSDFLLGWNQAKLTNSSRLEGLCTGVVDVFAFPIAHPLHLPHLLFSSQYGTRGERFHCF